MARSYVENITNLEEFQRIAKELLDTNVFNYYSSGSMGGQMVGRNESAFARYRVRPRILVDVSKRDASIEIQGRSIEFPVGVSPTALQKLAHSDGECASARAAGKCGTVFILSTLSSTSIEDVTSAAPDTIKWFQTYVYVNRDITRTLIKRAEKAGFKAIVVTVDSPVFGVWYEDIDFPPSIGPANFEGTEFETSNTLDTEEQCYIFDQSQDWNTIKWIKSVTSLPVIVKGILTREDARLAVKMGVNGIIVSNHGGRQLDCSPTTLEALPEVVNEVRDDCDVYFDGGVRSGSDAFKAVALGAKMVFVGRLPLWGLACGGENGVKRVLNILKHQFDTTMALAGCRTIDEMKRSENLIVSEKFYSKL